jgi:RNA polymerase sigma factor (sigma-70 family)
VIEPLTESQQSLAVEAVSRAERIARRYARIFPEHEHEFRSSALWGVVRAASSYDPVKGETWERWSLLAAKGEISDFLDNSYLKRRSSIANEESLLDNQSELEYSDKTDRVRELLSTLPGKHRELCEIVYLEGVSPSAAARTMGLSESSGRRIHIEAMELLRLELAA